MALAAAGGLFMGAAAAGDMADYVFEVPVKISKLGPGHKAAVQCRTGGEMGQKGQFNTLSTQITAVPLDGGGNYSGKVTVKVPLAGGKPGVPSHYECFLVLDGGSAVLPSKSATLKVQGTL
jgi:hypothetical protein